MEKQSFTVLVVSSSEMGEFIPAVRIAEELQARGHTVHIFTNSYKKERCLKLIEEAKCIGHYADDGLTELDVFTAFANFALTFEFMKKFMDELRRVSREVKPDVAVVDMAFWGAFVVMEEEKVPFVINYPMPLSQESQMIRTHDSGNLTVCCGLACWRQTTVNFLMENVLLKMIAGLSSEEMRIFRAFYNQKIKLINSFWGLDPTMVCSPEWIMTGSLVRPRTGLIEQLKEKNIKLFEWLEESEQKEKPVVYLALGSICYWAQWSVDALYHGLKELNVRIVWGMDGTTDLLPVKDDPDVWAADWLPQVEILAHPAIKAGLSHCGYGSLNEFISSAVPIVAFPHCNDQGPNASLLIKQKIAVPLIPPYKAYRSMDPKDNTFKTPIFTKADVVKAFKEVLENSEYKAKIKQVRNQSKYQGGQTLAAQVVERLAVMGDEKHLNLENDNHLKTNCCGSCFVLLLVLGLAYALVFSLVKYLTMDKIEVE